jgi:hypothetical protein
LREGEGEEHRGTHRDIDYHRTTNKPMTPRRTRPNNYPMTKYNDDTKQKSQIMICMFEVKKNTHTQTQVYQAQYTNNNLHIQQLFE